MKIPFTAVAFIAIASPNTGVSAFVVPKANAGRKTERSCRPFAIQTPIRLAEGDDENEIEQASGFDGEGFAGYLGPYALALLASIAVTVGFVQFILLDY